MPSPTPNGANGRDAGGRFAAGNAGGPGNPHARHVGKLRSALLAAVTEKDMRAIATKLVKLAKGGDVRAIRELFDRTLGKSQDADLIERIARLEEYLAEKEVMA